MLIHQIAHAILVATSVFASAAISKAQEITLETERDAPGAMTSILHTTGRTQQFLSPSTLDLDDSGSIRIRGVQFRFDGPTSSQAIGAQAIMSLMIRIGASGHTPNTAGAIFDHNLTMPLVTAYTATSFKMPSDSRATSIAQPWGGSAGSLRFTFPHPITVTVPSTGSLVLDIEVVTDPRFASVDANLDFFEAPQPQRMGTSVAHGSPCGYPSAGPEIFTEGTYDIGTSFTCNGTGFTPKMPVATWCTALLGRPARIQGSPCWSYLDLATGTISSLSISDAFGNFGEDPPLPIPPAPELCGSVLYLQSAGLTHQSPMNPIGIESSNYRTIKIGCRSNASLPGWFVTRPGSASATVGSVSMAGSLAIQLQTL
jgi:hypothetical protein